MKHLNITYHLTTDHSLPSDDLPHNIEVAETCITLAMLNPAADEVLNEQANSFEARHGTLSTVLQALAKMQGYQRADFVYAELDPAYAVADAAQEDDAQ